MSQGEEGKQQQSLPAPIGNPEVENVLIEHELSRRRPQNQRIFSIMLKMLQEDILRKMREFICCILHACRVSGLQRVWYVGCCADMYEGRRV